MGNSLVAGWRETVRRAMPTCDGWSVRRLERTVSRLRIRSGVLDPPERLDECGAMVTIHDRGGVGHAATADLSPEGLRRAAGRAADLARLVGPYRLFDAHPPTAETGDRAQPTSRMDDLPLEEKLGRLLALRSVLGRDFVADWSAELGQEQRAMQVVTSHGGDVHQQFGWFFHPIITIGRRAGHTVVRSFGRKAGFTIGFEQSDESSWLSHAERVVEELSELLDAPPCPSGPMDVVLMPDQLTLQIHETIGHPLELDRIVGDERNQYGSSFVEPGMFGHFQYGSELLNVVFDPTIDGQVASYAFDDEGRAAERAHLIERGVLVRGLGGPESEARTGVRGVACRRADSAWRVPIDRMASINLEPGADGLDAMIAAIERGVLLETNRSFSIDDRRDRFQFTTERGTLIEEGQLTKVVRGPSYRGRTVPFWRSLVAVGDRSTFGTEGALSCGKGEPGQVLFVSHASPACRFSQVEVAGSG